MNIEVRLYAQNRHQCGEWRRRKDTIIVEPGKDVAVDYLGGSRLEGICNAFGFSNVLVCDPEYVSGWLLDADGNFTNVYLGTPILLEAGQVLRLRKRDKFVDFRMTPAAIGDISLGNMNTGLKQ